MPRHSNAIHRRPVPVAIALVLTLTGVAGACGASAEDDPQAALEATREPIDVDIAYATLDGGEASLADYRGRPIVLNFFASWCAPCVREMPAFEEVHQARGGDVAFLGLSEDLVSDDALDLIARTGISYDTGWDPKGRVLNNFRAFGMPTTVFLTDDGAVAHTEHGALTSRRLAELIDEHLT